MGIPEGSSERRPERVPAESVKRRESRGLREISFRVELFPRLRVGILECGVGWVPYMMDRMDEELERKSQYSPRCKLKPSEYLRKGTFFFAAEVGATALPLAADTLRRDMILWASDYPHERDQRDFSGDIPTLIDRKDIDERLKRQIFFENPLRFYPHLRKRIEKEMIQPRRTAS